MRRARYRIVGTALSDLTGEHHQAGGHERLAGDAAHGIFFQYASSTASETWSAILSGGLGDGFRREIKISACFRSSLHPFCGILWNYRSKVCGGNAPSAN